MRKDSSGTVFLTTAGEMDRAEHKRVKNMLARNEKQPSIRLSSASGKGFSRTQRRDSTIALNISTRQLGLTREGMLDQIQRQIRNREAAKFYAEQNPGTVHVKDGKPMTEKGAKMLGVQWPQ